MEASDDGGLPQEGDGPAANGNNPDAKGSPKQKLHALRNKYASRIGANKPGGSKADAKSGPGRAMEERLAASLETLTQVESTAEVLQSF